MNFNEFLAHAKKRNGVPLDTLAKEVGAHMVLYPESGLKVIEKALAPIESPEVIRWDLLSTCLNEGDALDMAVVIFEVHGQSKGKARRVIQIKRAQ